MKSVIDVGGSNSKFFVKKEDNALKFISSVKTPDNPNKLLDIIVEHIRSSNYSEYHLGLPGPIYGEERMVFLPPLGYFFDLNLLRSLTLGKNLIAGNDCSILHGLLDEHTTVTLFENKDCSKQIQGSVCVTIGTSFGISVTTESSFRVSLEMAHIPISCVFGLSQMYATDLNCIDTSLSLSKILNSKNLLSCHQVASGKQGNKIITHEQVNFVRELIIGSSILASKLLGIEAYDIYIVSGIGKVLHDLVGSSDFHHKLCYCHPNIGSIRLFHQSHVEQSDISR